ncbi:M20 metallopeptidase family protein [Peptoniphilus sp. SGI.035]|uniref:M20 metallopeptidase family protein n=1 Tax=Peptoniphilus sp. SGI.035 TaxID=3420564 RepID=UPI003D05974B
MNDLLKKVLLVRDKYIDQVISIRRKIHKNPELGFEEFETSKLIKKSLESLGITDIKEMAKTGIVAVIDSGKPGKTLALRSELDALPIDEDTNLEFKSTVKNKMHACGHDVHAANLLGAAFILNELKNEFSGKVKLIFQPAEETGAGGKYMIEDGALENPKVDAIFGLHTVPEAIGNISYGFGEQTAYTDFFEIEIIGKSSHSAKPQEGIDAILVGSNIVTSINTIISKFISPFDNATITIGTFCGGKAENIIADGVKLSGMIRATSLKSKNEIKDRIEKIVNNHCRAMGASSKIKFIDGYPAVINDKNFTEYFASLADDFKCNYSEKILNVYEVKNPILAAEDFGFYSQLVPACYISIGAGNYAPQHNPKFRVDEDVFKISLSLTAYLTINYLKEKQNE